MATNTTTSSANWTTREEQSRTEITESRTNTCPECGGSILEDDIEAACQACGLVVDESPIDHGPEWRQCNSEAKRRVGSPRTPARHDRGLSTRIGHKTDGAGNTLAGSTQQKFRRLREHQRRGKLSSKRDQNLAHGFGEVRRVTSALDLSQSLRNQACELFRSAQSADLLLGRSIEGMATASVYAVCRCNNRTLLLADVAAVARVDQSRVELNYGVLNRELELPTPPREPGEFIPRLASTLDVTETVQHRARELASMLMEAGQATGKHPAGVAAACLYVAAREHHGQGTLTQIELADAADVSPPTIRGTSQTLFELIGN